MTGNLNVLSQITQTISIRAQLEHQDFYDNFFLSTFFHGWVIEGCR